MLEQCGSAEFALLLGAPAGTQRGLDPALIPGRLAGLVGQLVDRRRVAGIVAAGGDGARAIMDTLGAAGFDIRDEVMAGLPLGVLAGGRSAGLAFATKAGGFGDDGALLQAVDAIRVGVGR